jgi:hypothetical protein
VRCAGRNMAQMCHGDVFKGHATSVSHSCKVRCITGYSSVAAGWARQRCHDSQRPTPEGLSAPPHIPNDISVDLHTVGGHVLHLPVMVLCMDVTLTLHDAPSARGVSSTLLFACWPELGHEVNHYSGGGVVPGVP